MDSEWGRDGSQDKTRFLFSKAGEMDVEPACVSPPIPQPHNQPQADNGLRFYLPGRVCLLVKTCLCFNVYNMGILCTMERAVRGLEKMESLDFRIFQDLPNHSTK